MENLINKINLGDCLDVMRLIPDKSIDLVLIDPPYGINYGGQLKGKGDGNGGADKNGWKSYDCPDWDRERPKKEIFDEILRISKNQIIWGGNYFSDYLPSSQCWFVWNKGQRDFSLADGELAYTSFNKALRIFDYSRSKALQDGKIHPTQKPVALFKWCLDLCSKENDLILDCFSGSGTTAIACHDMKRNFICIEKDEDYYKKSCERLENFKKQQCFNF